jgi:hypothetical protein
MMVVKIAIALIAIAGFAAIGAGFQYLMATEFTSYHAEVVGKSWSEIAPGMQSIVLGLLTIVGGGFMASGFSMLFLLVPLYRGELWAHGAILVITSAMWAPTQYVTIALRIVAPEAQTPVVPTAFIIGLVFFGVVLSFLARMKVKKNGA